MMYLKKYLSLHAFIHAAAAFSVCTFVAACSEDSDTGSLATVCVPNATVECTCISGDVGFQLCREDGAGFTSPCECSGSTATDANDGADATESADSADTTDATDSSDTTDATDSSNDNTDSADTTDSEDTSDASDSADTSDGNTATDAADMSDTSDSTDAADSVDITDGMDTADGMDATDGMDTTDGMDAADNTDAGTGLDATDTSYVSGGGAEYVEPFDNESCITQIAWGYMTAKGGILHRMHESTDTTAPVREQETGKPLSGIQLTPGMDCGLDTAQGVWCWKTGIPNSQKDEIWPGLDTAVQIIDSDGEPLRATHGTRNRASTTTRNCLVRTDSTIACWGPTLSTSVETPNGHFPSTPGCNLCASYPTTVRTAGATGDPLTGMKKVHTTEDGIAAVDTEGALWLWGRSQLISSVGEIISLPYHVPQVVDGIPPITEVVLGDDGICVLTEDAGEVWCRGTDPAFSEWTVVKDEQGESIQGVVDLKIHDNTVIRLHQATKEVWLAFLDTGSWNGDYPVLQGFQLTSGNGESTFDIVSMSGYGSELWAVDTAGGFHIFRSLANPSKSFPGFPKYYDKSAVPAVFGSACMKCIPTCGFQDCGSDGCGGTCWNCAGDDYLCINEKCVAPDCTPSCEGKTCGDDGCGGTCGTCEGAKYCDDGQCAPEPCAKDTVGLYVHLKTGALVYGTSSTVDVVIADTETPLLVDEALHAYEHANCGLKDGSPWCWTYNSVLRAAYTLTENPSASINNHHNAYPIKMANGEPMTGVESFSAGNDTLCAVIDGGKLHCWGATLQDSFVTSDTSEACQGYCTPFPTPVLNSPDGGPVSDAVQVELADQHGCFVRTDGTVWCWGYRGFSVGVTGWEDSNEAQPYPVKVQGLPGPATSVHVGPYEACAVLEDTTAWCWGKAYFGAVGTNLASSFEVLHYPEPIRYGPYGEHVIGITDVLVQYYGKTLLLTDGTALAFGIKNIAGTSVPQPTPAVIAYGGAPVNTALRLRGAAQNTQRKIITTEGSLFLSTPSGNTMSTSKLDSNYDDLCAP